MFPTPQNSRKFTGKTQEFARKTQEFSGKFWNFPGKFWNFLALNRNSNIPYFFLVTLGQSRALLLYFEK